VFNSSDGTYKNLTNTPGIAERYPIIAPDNRSVAYVSDESGEYALHVRSLEDGSAVGHAVAATLKLQQRRGSAVVVDEVDVLAEGAQRERHRELRADRIAVRPAVRREDEALALTDRVDDPVQFLTTTGHRLCER